MAFIILSVVGLSVLVVIHFKTQKTYRVPYTGEGGVEVKIDNVHYSRTREGKLEWELDARRATRYKKDDLMVFETLKMKFYPAVGTPYTLSAKEGIYREPAGIMDASGEVRMRSEDGYLLETEKLRYSSKNSEVATDEPVHIIYSGMDVTGNGFLMDTDKGKLYIRRNVKALLSGDAL